ncbi:DUF3617 domain-containing protein [Ideonella sp.]|uniref:DUF3617 domain-containing protein n=1 Tax=Ideonella sp. TaxID=1929293 RepID=UPI0035B19C7B
MNTSQRLALLTAALALTTAAQAENLKPGQWSRNSSISADGQHWNQVPPSQGCLTPAEASRSIEESIQKMVSEATQSGCRAVNVKADAGKASGRFECPQPSGTGTVDVQASYSSDRYEMSMVGTNLADRNGSGMVIPKIYMKHEGHNVGACKG